MLTRSTIHRLNTLRPERLERFITEAINTVAEIDITFTAQEMRTASKTGSDTAPGKDKIYSMISHLGSHATQILLHLFNLSLTAGRLPKCWKDAVIQPIPKQEVGAYRPISLLSCLSKTMERAVLKRLRSLIPHPHRYTFAYCKGLGTRDSLAAIHSLTDGKKCCSRLP